MQPSAKSRILGKSPKQEELERLFFEAAMRQQTAKLSQEGKRCRAQKPLPILA